MFVPDVSMQDKDSFKDFSFRDWCDYYAALNAEKPVEECGLDLSENEKLCYNQRLKELRQERAANPGMPISYDVPKYSHFE